MIEVKNEAAGSGKALREEVNSQLQALLATIRDTLQQSGTTQKESLDQVGGQLRLLTQGNVETREQLRKTIEERRETLRKENETKPGGDAPHSRREAPGQALRLPRKPLLDHLLANDAILLACQFCDRLRDRVGGSTDGPVLLKYRRHQAASAAKPSAAPET